MDADNVSGIRYALETKFGMKVVTSTQVVIVSTLIKHPGVRAAAVANYIVKSHGISPSTSYKAYRKLKESAVIGDNGHLNLTTADMIPKVNGERIGYPLVGFVKERVLPHDTDYVWPHIAAYIATLPNPVGICEELKKVIEPMEQLNMLYEMQNGLAFCSIMACDVSQWADMKGDIAILEFMQDLFKKAGLKIK